MAEQATLHLAQAERRGSWVYLDPRDAREHPDYGVFGWALFLLGALFVGPMIILWQDVEIVFGPYDSPDDIWIILAIDAVLLLASWTACRLLGAERRQFYTWFFLTVIVALCSLAAFVSLCFYEVRDILPFGLVEPEEGGFEALLQAVPKIVWWGIGLRIAAIVLASAYVMQSRRLQVTVDKRVSPRDPFISRAWTAAVGGQPLAEPAARYPTAEEARAVAEHAEAATPAPAAGETQVVTRTATRTETREEIREERRVEPAAPATPAAEPAQPAAATTTTTTTTTATTTAPTDDRRLRARLDQLDKARAAGLISDVEYEARRASLLGQN